MPAETASPPEISRLSFRPDRYDTVLLNGRIDYQPEFLAASKKIDSDLSVINSRLAALTRERG